MDGDLLGTDSSNGRINFTSRTYINWFFRRAPGVFDEVCYTGNGGAQDIQHNLGVAPEFLVIKNRTDPDSLSPNWIVGTQFTASTYTLSNLNGQISYPGTVYDTNIAAQPTIATFQVNANPSTGRLNYAYVAYLFATLAGISKVGSYTGNGTSLNLNMGFSGNARFFLCKRTDSTGDWFVWDSVRGINGSSANDPHLSLNTTAAEVTTDSSVEPYTTGITVVQNSTTNINVTSATYIYLAFA